MTPEKRLPWTVLMLAAAAALATATASAAETDFYKGKTIKVIIRSGPGGGNDDMGRLIARHIGKHIPGNPKTIAQNMDGGGGLVAANYMATRAKRDGTEIAILSRDVANVEKLGATGVLYKSTELIPLGSAASDVRVFLLRKDHPVSNLEELRSYGKTVKFSGTGGGTAATQQVAQLREAGFPVQEITGYDGTQEKLMAVARGEVDGTTGSYSSMTGFIKDEGLKIVAKMGGTHPDLKGVTDIREVLLDPDARAAAEFMAAPMIGGRPFFTTPGVPAERVKILRRAFEKALQDPELLKEAERAKLDIAWTSAEDLEKTYKQIMSASERVVALIKNPVASVAPAMLKHKGKVTKVEDEGRKVFITYQGAEVGAELSNSRTKVTIKGKEAKRKSISAGMTCQLTYPKAGAEATNVDCE